LYWGSRREARSEVPKAPRSKHKRHQGDRNGKGVPSAADYGA